MITIIIILSILLGVSILVNVNQMRKQEQQEDYINDLEDSNTGFYNFHHQLKTKINQASSEMRNADRLGAFEASDEIGNAFSLIKDVIEDLSRGME